MQDIELSNVSLNYGFGKDILKNADMTVNSGEKVALVGDNGTGKTSILRLIAGKEMPNSGAVSKRRDATIGYLRQTAPNIKEDLTVREFIQSIYGNISKIGQKMHEIEQKMGDANTSPEELEKLMEEYGKIQDQYINAGGYDIGTKVEKMASDLKITDLLDQKYNELSGGQKTITCLARLLLAHPDVLLLDEPTNHLDIQSLEWLQDFIKNYSGSVVLVSHDRYFLDQTVGRVISIQDGKLKSYPGNYTKFAQAYNSEKELQAQAYVTQQKKIEDMQDTIRKNRAWGAQSSEKAYRVAKRMERKIDEMDKVEKPKVQKDIPLSFNQETRSGNDVLSLEDVYFTYDDPENIDSYILGGTNMKVQHGDRVCIVGKNGTGKSTILKLIRGELESQAGQVKKGSNVKVGYLPQQVEFEDENSTILDEFQKHFKGGTTEARSTLAAFHFKSDDVFKKLSSLSGGERVRLKFAELVQNDVNLLLLDEPTNHLDIRNREILEQALNEFKGTEVFVSHDRYFINKVANRVEELENGELKDYIGNYDDYREQKAHQNPLNGPGSRDDTGPKNGSKTLTRKHT